MGLLGLIFDKPKKFTVQVPAGSGTEREMIIIDAAENVRHPHDAQATDNPVEEGSDITDHVDVKPKMISFDGIVSEAPISVEKAIIGNVAGAIGGLVGGALGGIAGTIATTGLSALGGALLDEPVSRTQEAFDAMEEIQEKKIPVTIVTGLRVYNNMILTEFTPVETTAIGKSLSFTATFREIRIVQSEQITLPEAVLEPDVAASAMNKLNEGAKVAGVVNDQVAGRSSALLSGGQSLGFLGG
jgi:uncharacterized protein YcfJ